MSRFSISSQSVKHFIFLLGSRTKSEHNNSHVFTNDLKKFTRLLLIILARQGLKLSSLVRVNRRNTTIAFASKIKVKRRFKNNVYSITYQSTPHSHISLSFLSLPFKPFNRQVFLKPELTTYNATDSTAKECTCKAVNNRFTSRGLHLMCRS